MNRRPSLKDCPTVGAVRDTTRPVAKFFPKGHLSRAMPGRCLECFADLPEDADWVCPSCGYTLRTPASSKVGLVFMLLGLVLLGTYVAGPENLGLRTGWMPTDLADLTIANYSVLVAGALFLGMALVAVGAFRLRSERARVAA